MKPNEKFLNRSNEFWALVKLSSEYLGYSERKSRGSKLKRHNIDEIQNLSKDIFVEGNTRELVLEYLNFRADLLEEKVQPLLMDKNEAQEIFESLTKDYCPKCSLPYNKQKGEKFHPSYLT